MSTTSATTPVSGNAGNVTQYASASASNAYGAAKKSNGTLTQSDFLNLLSTQLKYQDPTNPVSNTDFAAQMAQFSSLTEMNNLNSTMTGFVGVDQLSAGSSLIGKTVSTDLTDTAGNAVGGVVSSVSVQNGAMTLNVGGQQVKYSDITGVQPTTAATTPAAGTTG